MKRSQTSGLYKRDQQRHKDAKYSREVFVGKSLVENFLNDALSHLKSLGHTLNLKADWQALHVFCIQPSSETLLEALTEVEMKGSLKTIRRCSIKACVWINFCTTVKGPFMSRQQRCYNCQINLLCTQRDMAKSLTLLVWSPLQSHSNSTATGDVSVTNEP